MPGALGCNPFIRKVFDLTNTFSNERFEFNSMDQTPQHSDYQVKTFEDCLLL